MINVTKPAISVIIPVYNAKKYLTRCLESVFSQSFLDYEIIAVDDGSTDGSGEILDFYKCKDDRLIVYHQSNKGIAGARKAGLERARGQYIAFVDSDDYIYQDFLSRLYSTALSQKAEIVMCDYDMIYESKTRYACLGLKNQMLINAKDAYLKGIALSPVLWNKLYKRAWIEEKIAQFKPLHTGEDYDFNVQLLPGLHLMATIPDSLYAYVQNPESVMHVSKRIEVRDTFVDGFLNLIKDDRFADTLGTDGEDLLAATAFVGLMFSTASVGQNFLFFRNELRKYRNWSGFPEFCKSVIHMNCLNPLVTSGAMTRRFAGIMQVLFFPCCFHLDAVSAWLTVPVNRLIVWKKRRISSNYK